MDCINLEAFSIWKTIAVIVHKLWWQIVKFCIADDQDLLNGEGFDTCKLGLGDVGVRYLPSILASCSARPSYIEKFVATLALAPGYVVEASLRQVSTSWARNLILMNEKTGIQSIPQRFLRRSTSDTEPDWEWEVLDGTIQQWGREP